MTNQRLFLASMMLACMGMFIACGSGGKTTNPSRKAHPKPTTKQDALLISIKTDKRPIFECALDAIKMELPKRFGRENSKDVVIPTDHKELRLENLDSRMLDDQGREDTWVVHGWLISKGKDAKSYKMTWEVTVIAKEGELSAGLVGLTPLP